MSFSLFFILISSVSAGLLSDNNYYVPISNNVFTDNSTGWYNDSYMITNDENITVNGDSTFNGDVSFTGSTFDVDAINSYFVNVYVEGRLYGDLGILSIGDNVEMNNGDIFDLNEISGLTGDFTTVEADNLNLGGVIITSWDDVNLTGGGSSVWRNDSGVAIFEGKINVSGAILGKTNNGSIMDATGEGSLVSGYSSYFNFYIPSVIDLDYFGNITASGKGAFATGYAYTGLGVERTIDASGDGSFAGGYAFDGDIIGSGNGSLTWGFGNQLNEHKGGFNVGGGNSLTGTSNFAGVVLGASNVVNESYGVGVGFGNKVLSGATFGAVALGSSSTANGSRCVVVGQLSSCDIANSVTLGIGIHNNIAQTVAIGKDGEDIHIDANSVNISKALKYTPSLNTGGNAGTDLCLDANNQLCACGSCA